MIHQVLHLFFLHSMEVRTNFIGEMSDAITDDNRRWIMKVIRVSGSFLYSLVHLLGAIIGFNWKSFNFLPIFTNTTSTMWSSHNSFTVEQNLENNVAVCHRMVRAASISVSLFEPFVEGKLKTLMPYFAVFGGRLIGRFGCIWLERNVVSTWRIDVVDGLRLRNDETLFAWRWASRRLRMNVWIWQFG